MLAALILLPAAAWGAEQPPRLVIVIDDMGNNLAEGKAALNLQGPVTYSFLPHTTYTRNLAERAYSLGKEIMLHVPMENTHNRQLGPGALLASMGERRFKRVLIGDLAAVPYVVGVNNHMGSYLTRKHRPMNWVMDVARQQGLFFLDSRTTPYSVAGKVAGIRGVPSLQRDIFLDHVRAPDFIQQQFTQAVRMAQDVGSAIVIAHPYPMTVRFLQAEIPGLADQGIELVSASELARLRYPHQMAKMNQARLPDR